MFKNQPKGNVIDLDTHNATVLVAEGGKPGIGNKILGGSKERKIHSSPRTYMAGSMGEQKSILLELKLIADVGLVGFPNAGKSTLLKALSNANPTIAAYPFTTLHPNIGVIQYSDLERVTMADIPGLIDGAHDNRGLGHDFLRHIERTKILLYVIDGAGSEGRSPIHDFLSLRNELQLYDPTLLDKPSIVFSNKHDLKKAISKKLQKEAAELGLELYHGTAQKGVGMAELANKLREILENTKLKEKEKDQ
jgi:GTP-binding protein